VLHSRQCDRIIKFIKGVLLIINKNSLTVIFLEAAGKSTRNVRTGIGAGMDFSTLWTSIMAVLADPRLKPDELQNPGPYFSSSEFASKWLYAAAITRKFLADFIISTNYSSPCDFKTFLNKVIYKHFQGSLNLQIVERVFSALGSHRPEYLPDFYELRNLYQIIHPEGLNIASDPPESLDGVWRRCGPISARLGLSTRNAGEQWLIQKGLAYLQSKEGPTQDNVFELLFWQTIRVRCLLYRMVVQRPMTAGLQWFLRFYGRLSPLRRPLEKARAEISFNAVVGIEWVVRYNAAT
jgi:hypothetical protein